MTRFEFQIEHVDEKAKQVVLRLPGNKNSILIKCVFPADVISSTPRELRVSNVVAYTDVFGSTYYEPVGGVELALGTAPFHFMRAVYQHAVEVNRTLDNVSKQLDADEDAG